LASRRPTQYCARRLRHLCRQFIEDRNILPINPFGEWSQSLLMEEDLTNDINLFLLEQGKDITAKKLMDYLNSQDVQTKHDIDKKISERTARRYLNALGFRWSEPKKGQYADGHERDDVRKYRDNIFIPRYEELQQRMQQFTREGLPAEIYGPRPEGKEVVAWFHDETIFYAHDRRRKSWYPKDGPAKPYAKGEGVSLMIADFVSANFGWLRSPDNSRNARRIMKPGKARDGYFTNDDICDQATDAIAILKEFYPEYEHVLIYDNASTHLKRAPDALSARQMPKFTPPLNSNWLVEVTQRDPETGKIVYQPDGKPSKIKIPMADTTLPDGTPQSLYFPPGHPRQGVFKGMAVILEERGLGQYSKLKAQCGKSFNCLPGASTCCCRRVLYNQPDFMDVPSMLSSSCQSLGVEVLFLPKFHCELNFIEQCWGFAKRLYRMAPESSREDALEKNALDSLQSIPLETMRRFANRSARFIDAYSRGLNGRQAAWAARKYKGHRVLPESIMDELEKAGIF
ncbi:hypothetical protein CVT24_005070, partial [Panaeolus cyanescens]